MSINELAKKQYDWVDKMGWHNKSPLEYLALIASEVGEAVNECRGEYPTDKLAEELVDILLRTLDFSAHLGIDIEKAIESKMARNLELGTRGRLK